MILGLEPVFHGVLDQLVDNQRTGCGLLTGQVDSRPVHRKADLLAGRHDLPDLGDDPLSDVPDIDRLRLLQGQELVDHGHTQDPG